MRRSRSRRIDAASSTSERPAAVAALASVAVLLATLLMALPGAGAESIEAPLGTPTPTPTGPPANSTITLASDSSKATVTDTVEVTGTLTSDVAACVDDEQVNIQSIPHGSTDPVGVSRTKTDVAGAFTAEVRVLANADYYVETRAHENCPMVQSPAVTILAATLVRANAGGSRVEKGDKLRFAGRVQPAHEGTKVVLESKNGGSWHAQKKAKVEAEGRFNLEIKVRWVGKRVFRVRWPKSGETHEEGVSDKIAVRARKAHKTGEGSGGPGGGGPGGSGGGTPG